MKRITPPLTLLLSLLLLVSSSGCGGNQPGGGSTVVSVGANVGLFEVRLTIDENGNVAIVPGITKSYKFGFGLVGLSVGIEKAYDLTRSKPYYLFIVRKDPSGHVVTEGYEIGKKFRVTFDRQDWVKEITGQNDSIIIAVERNADQLNNATFEPTPETFDIPSIRANVTSLRFFEGGSDMPSYTSRNYQSRFPVEESRYIYWELNLNHPTLDRRVEFQVEAVYYRPDGNVFVRQNLDSHLDADWKTSYHNSGSGWSETGKWQAGSYRVELLVQGKRVAKGSFEVYEDLAKKEEIQRREYEERLRQERQVAEERRQQEYEQQRREDENRKRQEYEKQRQYEDYRRQQEAEQRRKDERTQIIIRGVGEVVDKIRNRKRN